MIQIESLRALAGAKIANFRAMGPWAFRMTVATSCTVEGVHPFATLEEGCLEMASRGSIDAVAMLIVMGVSDESIMSAIVGVKPEVWS